MSICNHGIITSQTTAHNYFNFCVDIPYLNINQFCLNQDASHIFHGIMVNFLEYLANSIKI